MNRNIFFFIIILVLSEFETLLYSNEDYKTNYYSINLPEEWILTGPSEDLLKIGISKITLTTPTSDEIISIDFKPLIMISLIIGKKNYDYDTELNEYIKALTKNGNIKYLLYNERKIDNKLFKELFFESVSGIQETEYKLKMNSILIVKNKIFISIEYMNIDKVFDKYYIDFDKIIKSLKLF